MGQHAVFESVEAMVEPSALAEPLRRPVGSVVLEPMVLKGWSSTEADFFAVLVDDDRHPSAVIKRITWSRDWHAIATDDRRGREVAIWEREVLDRLPVGIAHAVLAAARFPDGAALMMRDLTDFMLPEDTPLSLDREMGVLRSMAALHAAHWQNPPLRALGDAVCRLERMISRSSPTTLAALSTVVPDNELVTVFPTGWERLPEVIDPGVARNLRALADDPAPAVAALAAYPQTLLHGDLRSANVAWDGTRAIPIDWQPLIAPPGFELAYFLWSLAGRAPLHPETAMACYLDMLRAELDEHAPWTWWDDHLDVCIAAVVSMMGCIHGLPRSPEERLEWGRHDWWVERSRRGLRLIEQA